MSDNFDAKRATSAMRRMALVPAVWLMLAGAGFGQGVQTGTVHGTVTDQQNLAIPAVSVTVTSPALLGTREAVSNGVGHYTISALPAGVLRSQVRAGGVRSVDPTGHGPSRPCCRAGCLDAGRRLHRNRAASSPRRPRRSPRRSSARTSRTPRSTRSRPRVRSRASHNCRPAVTENSPQHQSGRDQRRVRVRQHLHDQRRRRQRQPPRAAAEPVRRGCDPGDTGPDVRDLGGVRPVHRRRDQRGHEERQQHILRELSHQLRESRRGRSRTPIETSSRLDKLGEIHEATLGGPIMHGPALVLRFGPLREHGSSNTLPVTLTDGTRRPSEQARRDQAHGRGRAEPCPAGRIPEQQHDDDQRIGRAQLPRRSAQPRRRRRSRIGPSSRTIAGCAASTCCFEAQYSERRWMTGGGGTSTNLVDSPFFAATLGPYVFNAPYFDATDQETAQQPAADWQRHELLEQGRQPRAQDRIRVVPQPARQAAARSHRPVTCSAPTSRWTQAAGRCSTPRAI